MEPTRAALGRYRKSPYSDHLLGLSSSQITTVASVGDDLNEDDVLWTGDFSPQPPNHHTFPSSNLVHRSPLSKEFRSPESFGILAALPENESSRALVPESVFHLKASTSNSPFRTIPTIPRPSIERQISMSSKFRHSAPVDVPVLSRAVHRQREFDEVVNDDEDDDGEMLPPHDLVARNSSRAPVVSCSVLEGLGRTLKGRDLRQVRNAVWRSTGFLD